LKCSLKDDLDFLDQCELMLGFRTLLGSLLSIYIRGGNSGGGKGAAASLDLDKFQKIYITLRSTIGTMMPMSS